MVEGFRLRVWGLEFKGQGLGSRVQDWPAPRAALGRIASPDAPGCLPTSCLRGIVFLVESVCGG